VVVVVAVGEVATGVSVVGQPRASTPAEACDSGEDPVVSMTLMPTPNRVVKATPVLNRTFQRRIPATSSS
jgi:hypothetical protein